MDLKHFLDPKDGGLLSRKFLLTVYSIHVMAGLALLTIHWPSLGTYLQTVNTGILGALGLYFTGNLVAKNTVAKAAASDTTPTAEP